MNAEIQALEKLMATLLDEHCRLLECMQRKAEAIRTARIEAVGELVKTERVMVRTIGDVERHRIALTRKITRMLKPDATEAFAMSDIIAAVQDEAMRRRLSDLTEQLRGVVNQVRERSSVIRAAAEALAQHMAGVMQTVHSALSRAGVYGSKGQVAMGAQLDFGIDIKS